MDSSEARSIVAPEDASLWRSLRQAIAGSQHDFTQGPLGRAIILLAVPMVLEWS
jgi:hypothetical protein